MKRLFILLFMVVIVFSLTFMGISCKEETAPEEEAVEEEAAPVEEEAEEAEEEVEEAAEEIILGYESSTYWIEKAGLEPKGEFTIYNYKDENCEAAQIARKFVEIYPEVTLNWVTIPGGEYASKVAIELETDTAAFDAYWVNEVLMLPIKDFLADLTSLIPEELKNDFAAGALPAVSSGDTMYGVPYMLTGSGVIYYKDILKQAGYDTFPETWEEFLDACEASVVDEDNDGVAEVYGFANESCTAYSYFYQYEIVLGTIGVKLWNGDKENPEVLFNNEEGKRALEILKKLYASDFSDPVMATQDAQSVRESIAAGNTAIGIAGPGAVYALMSKDYPENLSKVGFGKFPSDPDVDYKPATGSMGYVMRDGGNLDAALGFMLFYASPEMQTFMTKEYGFPSVRYSMADNKEYVEQFPYTEAVIREATKVVRMYSEENSVMAAEYLGVVFEKYFLGSIDVDTALDELETTFIKAFEDWEWSE